MWLWPATAGAASYESPGWCARASRATVKYAAGMATPWVASLWRKVRRGEGPLPLSRILTFSPTMTLLPLRERRFGLHQAAGGPPLSIRGGSGIADVAGP